MQLIFEAANSHAVRPVVRICVRIATVEVTVTRVSTTHRTAPIVTVVARVVERTIVVIAVTRNRNIKT